jgi:beta-glucosidase
MKYILLSIIIIFSFYSNDICAQTSVSNEPEYLNTSLGFKKRTLDLVKQMSLKEKISQLGNNAPAIARLGILQYNWWNESLHGVARAGTATVFPQAIGMAASFDTDMMKQVADIISDEARAKHHEALRNKDYGMYKGLTFWSPNINIFRDPRWGRGHETYGEDPYLTGQMGIQFVKGLQGDDPKYLKVIATAKHFAVHNGPESERHTFNVVPNSRDLWETYLPAFKDLIVDAKAYSVMGAYNRVDGESSSASWLLLEDILRNKWGFEGYVVSDCGAINDIHANHKIVNNQEESAALGIRKGCDLNCGSVYQESLKRAVELGLIDEGEIDRSVYRLMLARMKLGMFDPPKNVPYAQIPFNLNDSKAHDNMALKVAQKSMTLLKNDGTLPLNKKRIRSIAIVGPNADNLEALRANYYGEASHPVTIIEGIKKALGEKIDITYSKGIPLVKQGEEKENDSTFVLSKAILLDVKKADVALFVGGLDATWEGEEMQGRKNADGFYGGDRTKIELPKIQQDAIRAMIKTGTPVVFVLMAGSAISFDGLDKELKAILMSWYPGQRGGDAVADVLFGDYNPAGRLPVTFYSATTELPDFKDYNMRAGKGFTYRYYQGEALYPFGHGLSYTSFKYSNLKIDKSKVGVKDEFTVSVTIKNRGEFDGDEVVQLYVKDVKSEIWMPIKQLRKFERITLKKGEEKTVLFKLKVNKDLRYYNSTYRKYMSELGDFEIQIGSSSKDIRMKGLINVN